MWLKLAAIAVGLLVFAGGRRGVPWTFAQLTSSSTARKYGVSNNLPPEFLSRARGLCIIAGALEEMGLEPTSGYRSPLVNALLHFEHQNPGVTPDPASIVPRIGKHSTCRALDVGSNTNNMPAREIRERVLANSVIAQCIDPNGAGGGALREFDSDETRIEPNEHVHFEFLISALEALDDGVRA
jgi:hypothetical protein